MGLRFVLGIRRSDLTMEPPAELPPSLVLRIATALSLVAALAHATVIRDHFADWWGYGLFFVLVAVLQLAYTAALALAPSRRLARLGIAGNGSVLALYVISRTSGIPFLGPHAGEAEAIGVLDAVCGAAEAGLIGALAILARRDEVSVAQPRARTCVVVAGWVAVSVLGVPGGTTHAVADHEIAHVEPLPTVPTDIPTNHPTPTVHHTPLAVAFTPADADPEPPADPCRPTVASPHGVPGAGRPGAGRAIVTVHEGNVWVYDLTSGDAWPLTRNKNGCRAGHALFKDERTVTFSLGDAIYDVDLVDGDLDRILEHRGGPGPFAWNNDRSKLAYLTWEPALHVFSNGTSKALHTWAEGGGRCGGSLDEINVEFSPNGKFVLATLTYLDFTNKTMFVFNEAGGNEVVKARMGTMGRWVDTDTIVYRDFDWTLKGGWHALDVTTGSDRALAMKATGLRLSVSPDGRRLAYDDDAKTPSLYVYEIASGAEKRLASGYVHAVWVASDRVAATSAKECTASDECMHSDWNETGSVSWFDLDGSTKKIDGLTSTMHAEVLFAADSGSRPAPKPTPTPSSSPSPAPTPTPAPTENPIEMPTPAVTPDPDPSGSPEASPTSSASPAPTETPAAGVA